MKSLFNLRTLLFAITVSLLAGCSGITETTLPDAEPMEITSGQTLNHETPDEYDTTDGLRGPVLSEKHQDIYEDRD